MSDVTEDWGQFIAMKVVRCNIGANKTNYACNIWGKSYRNATGVCVCEVKVNNTEFIPGHVFEELFNATRHILYDLLLY